MKQRNWCSQCGEPYLDADWQPTRACGPSHAIVARELAGLIDSLSSSRPVSNNPYQREDGLWTWHDETFAESQESYLTKMEAQITLEVYGHWLNTGEDVRDRLIARWQDTMSQGVTSAPSPSAGRGKTNTTP